jgi:NadR type nicotinamide-nucleotide adenylyltransferase
MVIDDASLRDLCLTKGLGVRALPHNDAPEDEHRGFVAWLCSSILDTTIDAVFTSESYGDGFAEALSRHFGGHTANSKTVHHECVDPGRESMAIRGTDARSDPYGQRQFLAPIVYSDLIQRVAILGGESSGKTTLAQSLANCFNTKWVPEYGRELWEQQNGELQFDDMLKIGLTQVARELEVGHEACRWLFCDTTPLTTAFYSQEMFGKVDPSLGRLALRDYDYFVLCAPDFQFVQDGTRQCADFRDRQHDWYLRELKNRKLPYCVVTGTVAERLEAVASLLEAGDRHDRSHRAAQYAEH